VSSKDHVILARASRDLEALAEEAQYNLFRNSLSDKHCLKSLLRKHQA